MAAACGGSWRHRTCPCTGPGRKASTISFCRRWRGLSPAGRLISRGSSSPWRRSRQRATRQPDRYRWPGSNPGPRPGSPRPAQPGAADADAVSRPPRIVVYRRPLMARADGDDDLGELVFEVVVEEFARLLGVSPEDIDPGYPAED